MRATIAVASAILAAIGLPGSARAADEEIQVYMDELNPAGKVGLDVHVNAVLAGDATLDYPGAEPALHRWRLTPEFSLGLGGGFEFGAYLPLGTIAPDGVVRAEGAKARLKWLAPHAATGWYWGANFELGRVGGRLDQNPWNAEFKLIGGWRKGPWTAAVNGNLDFTVSGPAPGPATFQLATKLSYALAPRLALGIESYNDLGAVKNPLAFAGTSQATYLALDTELRGWELNAGIGRGYGSNADKWTLKFVVGVPL